MYKKNYIAIMTFVQKKSILILIFIKKRYIFDKQYITRILKKP